MYILSKSLKIFYKKRAFELFFTKYNTIKNIFYSSKSYTTLIINKELINFSNEWINAEHEFMNKELETIRKELLEKIQHFVYDSSMKTFPLGDDIQTVMNNVDEKWNLTQSTKDNIVLLNNYGDDIYDIHQKLVRTGRDLLHI